MNLKMGPRIAVLDAVVKLSPQATVTSPKGGDPVIINGDIPGSAMDDKDANTGLTSVMVADHIATYVVIGKKSGGNSAISAGDPVYMQSDGKLDGDTGGTYYGRAFGNDVDASAVGTNTLTGQLVASGATTTLIRVWVGKGK